ncbi:MAG: hypothetical protein HY779_00325 [Rubrobacteridae bacterium]|nr:hypothetical protein [Rubrobacteridae bacterium]
MNNRRIGTLTFGIFMILLGVLLLLSLATGKLYINLLVELWPLLLCSLGIEILYNYRKNNEGKMLFDWASMFVLGLFGISAIGLYAFHVSGLANLVFNLGESSTYSIDISKDDIPVEASVKRIVIENGSQDRFTVKVENRDNVGIEGAVDIIARNRSEAQRIVDENKIFSTTARNGDLIIKTHPMHVGKWFFKGFTNTPQLVVLIPSDLPFDLISNHGNSTIMASEVRADWFVRQTDGVVDITIPKNANANIVANTEQFETNVKDIEGDKNTESVSDNTETARTAPEFRSREYTLNLGEKGPLLNIVNPYGNTLLFMRDNVSGNS